MKKVLGILLILSFALMQSACSTIAHGSKQVVKIKSSPEGTSIKIKDANGNLISEGINSLNLELARGNGYFKSANYLIEVEKPGYNKITIPLKGKLSTNTYLLGNLFSWFYFGWLIVDPINGSMWRLETPNGQKTNNIQIVLKENVNEKLLKTAVEIPTTETSESM